MAAASASNVQDFGRGVWEGWDGGKLIEVLPLHLQGSSSSSPSTTLVLYIALAYREASKALDHLKGLLPHLHESIRHLRRCRRSSDSLHVLIGREEDASSELLLAKLHEGGYTSAVAGVAQAGVERCYYADDVRRRNANKDDWPVLQSNPKWPLTPGFTNTALPLLRQAAHELTKKCWGSSNVSCCCALLSRDMTKVLTVATDQQCLHPLKHSFMVASEQWAEQLRKTGHAARHSEGQQMMPTAAADSEDDNYLCTNCTVVFSTPPCAMCLMACSHSRVRSIVVLTSCTPVSSSTLPVACDQRPPPLSLHYHPSLSWKFRYFLHPRPSLAQVLPHKVPETT